jgi:hypothetical protein
MTNQNVRFTDQDAGKSKHVLLPVGQEVSRVA